jgi:hypothetical protein
MSNIYDHLGEKSGKLYDSTEIHETFVIEQALPLIKIDQSKYLHNSENERIVTLDENNFIVSKSSGFHLEREITGDTYATAVWKRAMRNYLSLVAIKGSDLKIPKYDKNKALDRVFWP